MSFNIHKIKRDIINTIERKNPDLYLDLYISIEDPRCLKLDNLITQPLYEIYDNLDIIKEKYDREEY